MGRIDPSWVGYDWGVASSRLEQGDQRRSAFVRNEPGGGFAIEGAYETLSNLRDLEGKRGSVTLRRTGRIFGNAEIRDVSTQDRATGTPVPGQRHVGGVAIGARHRRLEGTVGLRQETDDKGSGADRKGTGFDEWRTSAAWILAAEKGRFEIGHTVRTDLERAGSTQRDTDRARTWDARALYTPAGRLLDLHYARRDLERPYGSRLRTDVANLLWSQDEQTGRFGQQIRGDLTTQEQEIRSKSIEYVGPGEGHYDSLGVYVGTGDYEVFLRPTGETKLGKRLDGSWRLEFAPGRGANQAPSNLASSLLKTSQWLLYATTSVRTVGSAGEIWSDLVDLLVARKDGVPLASYRLRLETSALPQGRWASPQLRFERERRRSNEYSNVQSRHERDLPQLTLRSTPTQAWTLEQEIQTDREIEQTRLQASGAPFASSGWRSARLRLGGWWRPAKGWTARMGLIGRARTRVGPDDRYDVLQVLPGVQWVGSGRKRLDLQATRTWVRGPEENLLGLERTGWEARGSLSLRLHRFLDATAIWEMRAPDQGRRLTSSRAEIRAVF